MTSIHFARNLDLSEQQVRKAWTTCSLVVACVGVGNVSQLTCDLLIHNLNCKLICDLDLSSVPAVVGANPYSDGDKTELTTCIQLYMNVSLKLAVLQVRAPPFPDCRKEYVSQITDFAASNNFEKIILISSSFASFCKDAELSGSQLRYALSKSFEPAERKQLQTSGWLSLQAHTDENTEPENQALPTFRLPGCGVASRLFDSLINKNANLRVCLLNFYTSEGDNSGDAMSVAQHLNKWLNLNSELNFTWSRPTSWCLLYGRDATNSLY